MTRKTVCGKCGAELAVVGAQELCPGCLLEEGLHSEAEARPAADSSAAADRPAAFENGKTDGPSLFPRPFGDYMLLEEIARGGMGIVYRARQNSLDRVVAVKMLLFGPLASAEYVQRFRTEAAAAASLQHPNIVAIHEVGFREGQHFFAMDYVAGRSLAEMVREGPLAARRAAACLKRIAEAIAYAHERGILHRDLKPSNVLIDEQDQPKVTDFGLAKRLEKETDLTLSGQVLGSPNYMPPEQAAAHRGRVDKRSDVYSLGAILYHLLTGRAPFAAGTVAETLQQVQEAEPVSPRVLNPTLSRDLETICLKCLEKEPVRRYRTVQELSEDLGRWLRNESILARPVSRAEKAWRWARRRPALVTTLLLLYVVLVLGSAGFYWQWQRAEENERITHRQLYSSDMTLALHLWESGDITRAHDLLQAHQPRPGREDLRGFEWPLLQRLCRESHARFTLSTAGSGVWSVAISPDGRTLASAGREAKLQLWEIETGRPLAELPRHQHIIHAAAFSPDGRMLASGGRDDLIVLWDLATRSVQRVLQGHQDAIRALVFSPDSRRLISGSEDKTLAVWEVATGQLLDRLEQDLIVEAIALSPANTDLLAVCGRDSRLFLWQVSTRQKQELNLHKSHLLATLFSPDGRVIASAGFDGIVQLWDVQTSESLGAFAGGAPIHCLAYSPDGQTLATAGSDRVIHLWNVRTRQRTSNLRGHTGLLRSLAFSRDGRWLASGSEDGTARLWKVIPDSGQPRILPHTGLVNAVAFSPNGTNLATAEVSEDKLRLWDLHTEQEQPGYQAGPRSVWCLAFAPDGGAVAVGGQDGSLRWWNVTGPRPAIGCRAHREAIERLAVSPDGGLVATASRDASLKLWNAATLELVAAMPGQHDLLRAVAFSADGQWLAAGGRDRQVQLWHPPTGPVMILAKHQGEIWAVAFSPDSRLLASAGADRFIYLWDLQERRLRVRFEGHDAPITSLAFSPDGRTLASGSEDSSVKLWNLVIQREVATLRGHLSQVRDLAFSPNGNVLATAGGDGTVRLWRAAPPSVPETAVPQR